MSPAHNGFWGASMPDILIDFTTVSFHGFFHATQLQHTKRVKLSSVLWASRLHSVEGLCAHKHYDNELKHVQILRCFPGPTNIGQDGVQIRRQYNLHRLLVLSIYHPARG